MRTRWLSRRAITLHLAVVLWAPACLFAGWWQVTRAMDGNALSYLYSFEWPAFALVGVYAWWSLVHTDPQTVGARAQRHLLAAGTTGDLVTAGDRAASAEASGSAPGTRAAGTGGLPGALSAGQPVRRRDQEDAALAAYNDRLAELAQATHAKSWRRR